LIPPAKRGGNKRHVEVREVMNGIMDADLPPSFGISCLRAGSGTYLRVQVRSQSARGKAHALRSTRKMDKRSITT
jgi:hypothetical protein